MDSKQYLNQISSEARPSKKPRKNFLDSRALKIVGGLVIATFVILIFGLIISSGTTSSKDQAISLKLHLDNTLSVISAYQPSVKSSDLRSSSASLSSILSNTSRELTAYLTEVYEYSDRNAPEKLVIDAALARDSLGSDLQNAKINGILDRIYARKMTYEISLIMNEESALTNSTSDGTLKTLLSSSYTSLETLYSKFNEFSETK